MRERHGSQWRPEDTQAPPGGRISPDFGSEDADDEDDPLPDRLQAAVIAVIGACVSDPRRRSIALQVLGLHQLAHLPGAPIPSNAPGPRICHKRCKVPGLPHLIVFHTRGTGYFESRNGSVAIGAILQR